MKNNWKLIFSAILFLLSFALLAWGVFSFAIRFGFLASLLLTLSAFFAFLIGRVLLSFWGFERDAKDVSDYAKKIKLEHEKRNQKNTKKTH